MALTDRQTRKVSFSVFEIGNCDLSRAVVVVRVVPETVDVGPADGGG
jgi:hypothetical protein